MSVSAVNNASITPNSNKTEQLRKIRSGAYLEITPALEKIFNRFNIDTFLQQEVPSSQLMQQILRSSDTLNPLLEKIKDHPEILNKKNENGETLLLQFVNENGWSQNFIGTHFDLEVFKNQQTLKRLLLAGPWEKGSLLTSLTVINQKTSSLWAYGVTPFLRTWPEVGMAILNRKDLSSEEREFVCHILKSPH